jgi:tRNA (cmo5U34)-methyltransferase
MDKVKQHFEEEAPDFDRTVLTLILDHPRMVEAPAATIPFRRAEPARIIDLGCGTVALAIRKVFPNA